MILTQSGVDFLQFTIFPKLPPELQVKIWGFTAHVSSRVIEICTRTIGQQPMQSWAKNPIPAILHACHDARKEGLKVYKVFGFRNSYSADKYVSLIFRSGSESSVDDVDETPIGLIVSFRTYINYSLDTVYLNTDKNLDAHMHGTILYWDNFRALGRTSSIQHIALSTNVLVDRWSEQFDATELVLYNNCLRSITFVTNDTFPLASREYCKAITGLKTESEADDKVFPGAEEYLEAFKEALTVTIEYAKMIDPEQYVPTNLPKFQWGVIERGGKIKRGRAAKEGGTSKD